jgi:hypothetical protein
VGLLWEICGDGRFVADDPDVGRDKIYFRGRLGLEGIARNPRKTGNATNSLKTIR